MKNDASIAAINDRFSILSATWIMSCNDQNPIMTYRGINDRLKLADDYAIKSLVDSRRELFRPGVPDAKLNPWKEELKAGSNVPDWIRKLPLETQRTVIENLSQQDVFRNQFRITSPDACALLTIDWGLQHIERLKKGEVDAKEHADKRFNLVVIPVASILIAILSLLATAYVQFSINSAQAELKKHEVSFKPKQEAYAAFMTSLLAVYAAAGAGDGGRLLSSIERMQGNYFTLEPFVDAGSNTELWRKYEEFVAFSRQLAAQRATKQESIEGDSAAMKFDGFRNYFKSRLYAALFSSDAFGRVSSK